MFKLFYCNYNEKTDSNFFVLFLQQSSMDFNDFTNSRFPVYINKNNKTFQYYWKFSQLVSIYLSALFSCLVEYFNLYVMNSL